MPEIRVGLIGVGGIAQAAHIPSLKTLGVPIVAVADSVEERAKQIAEQHGIPHAYGDYRQLLKREDVDAVVVSTPTSTHYPIVTAALKTGKHVLCEKPPAMNEREAEKMAELADQQKLVLMYALQNRYRNDTRALKKLVEQGKLGEVYYGRALYIRRRGAPGGWFAKKELSGGGPLLDIGVHVIDLTWWLMGKPKPISAAGFTFQKIGAKGLRLDRGWQPADVREKIEQEVVYDVEDYAGGFIRFENGAVLTFEVSWQINAKEQWGVAISGTEGGASLPPLELYTEILGEQANVSLRVDEGNGYLEEMREFLNCIAEGKKPVTDAWDGVTVMKMLTALYRSAEQGKELPIR
ncbi:MAG: Gfo/Idh/MocA family oxidoreductase [Armatimonadetes bacterium]|nr:Gfo/Idh/MocA family oxidoreductase [Armatimonadota bacterium]MCX7968010.1 Gfo/Idh/MocA family oxidoreductase [Armatimonadota bacterium]MDW8142057.1 Gfo/Idh/MocA family oxidoreductase [Armatimonadota bacterium]